MKIICPLTILCFLISCSTLTPPGKERISKLRVQALSLEKNELNGLNKNEKWYSEYIMAKFGEINLTGQSCRFYSNLAEDKKFPLHELAYIKTQKLCSYAPEELSAMWDKDKISPWLKEFYLAQSIQVSKEKKLPLYETKFSVVYVRYLNDRKDQVTTLLKSIKNTPDKNEKKLIEDKLYHLAPSLNPSPTDEELLLVGKDLESKREFEKARIIYRKIIFKTKVPLHMKNEAWNKLRLTYKKERKNDLYIDKTKKMIQFFSSALKKDSGNQEIMDAIIKSKIKYARILWTENKLPAGKKILEDLILKDKLSEQTQAYVYQILGKMETELASHDKAQEYFEKSITFIKPPSEFYDEIHWDLAWSYFLDQQYGNALLVLDKIINETTDEFFKHKLLFWKAKTLKEIGEYEDADSLFEELTKKATYSYYGLISYRELEVPIPNWKRKELPLIIPLEIQWLKAVEENNLAKKYLNYFLTGKKWQDTIPYFPIMDELGENKSIINMFFKIPEDLRDEIIDENLDFIYPLPNREIIRHYATEDLKEEYIYAIIRQESAFDPYAKSWAEAYGLMQVIPEEAKKLYKNLNLEYKSADDLYLPSINIPIGTAILKRNLKKFNGEFIPSTCSYNAKADVVEKWLKTRYHQDPLVFIENIPYEETKLYVKLVLRNFVLNLRQTSSDAFFFPEELLTLSK